MNALKKFGNVVGQNLLFGSLGFCSGFSYADTHKLDKMFVAKVWAISAIAITTFVNLAKLCFWDSPSALCATLGLGALFGGKFHVIVLNDLGLIGKVGTAVLISAYALSSSVLFTASSVLVIVKYID